MKIVEFKVDEIRFLPYNPNRLPAPRLESLASSHAQFGILQPIVVNDRKGDGWKEDERGLFVVGGEHRLRVARKLGMSDYPGVLVSVPRAEEQVMNLALNNAGDYDQAALGTILKELRAMEANLSATGLDQADVDLAIQEMERGLAGEEDEDAIPPLPLKAKTKPGELIELGDHRLLCGDAGDVDAVRRLVGDQGIHLVNTDPPYNVNTTSWTVPKGKSGRVQHGPKRGPKHAPLANDKVTEAEFKKLLASWFKNMASVLSPGRCFYIWGGYANCGPYPPALEAAGLYFSQAIIWHKQWPVLTRKDFMGDHEWCFYGWKLGAAHFKNKAIRNCTDLWTVRKINPVAMVHLTEKPVELFRKAMLLSSRPGERVLDLFAGSGAAIIAAEETGRKAVAMELDPLYCDVIRQRWKNFVGHKA